MLAPHDLSTVDENLLLPVHDFFRQLNGKKYEPINPVFRRDSSVHFLILFAPKTLSIVDHLRVG